jgi:hypothetical protein
MYAGPAMFAVAIAATAHEAVADPDSVSVAVTT